MTDETVYEKSGDELVAMGITMNENTALHNGLKLYERESDEYMTTSRYHGLGYNVKVVKSTKSNYVLVLVKRNEDAMKFQPNIVASCDDNDIVNGILVTPVECFGVTTSEYDAHMKAQKRAFRAAALLELILGISESYDSKKYE